MMLSILNDLNSFSIFGSINFEFLYVYKLELFLIMFYTFSLVLFKILNI